MSSKEGQKRPPGYYSRAARAQRGEAWRRRRAAAADRREEEQQDRQAREAAREKRLAPMRAWAERGLRRAEEEKAAAAERAKAQKKKPVKVLSRRAQRRLKAKVKEQNQPLAEKWQHKQGTPETLEKASHTQQGALARLFEAGYIDREQLEWADEIATVAEQIQSEVAVRTASLEARVDNQAGSTDRLYEGIKRARFHVAYATWRERVPQPKGAAIEMLTGDRIPYSTAARRYRMGRLRMKKLLIEALDLWPDCKAEARRQVDPASHAAFWAGLV